MEGLLGSHTFCMICTVYMPFGPGFAMAVYSFFFIRCFGSGRWSESVGGGAGGRRCPILNPWGGVGLSCALAWEWLPLSARYLLVIWFQMSYCGYIRGRGSPMRPIIIKSRQFDVKMLRWSRIWGSFICGQHIEFVLNQLLQWRSHRGLGVLPVDTLLSGGIGGAGAHAEHVGGDLH